MKAAYSPRQIVKSGSQTSEPIELTDYVVVQKKGNEIVLRDTKLNKKELWSHSQDFAGYCVRIGQKNYEFVRTITEKNFVFWAIGGKNCWQIKGNDLTLPC